MGAVTHSKVPIYRQAAIYRQRHSVALCRQTLVLRVELAAHLLRPVYEATRAEVFSGGCVQANKTSVRYHFLPQAPRSSDENAPHGGAGTA